MEFTSKLAPCTFISVFKNYKMETIKPIVILTPEDFKDDYLDFVKNEPYMNFITNPSQINNKTINVVPINLVTEEKFGAILVCVEGMSEEEKQKAFNTADEETIQRSIFTKFDDVVYYEQLKSNTKTTELIDKLDNYECSLLEIGTKYFCTNMNEPIIYRKNYFEAFNIDLIIENNLYIFDWTAYKKTPKKENLISYTFTDIKNDRYTKMHYIIGNYLYNYLENIDKIENGKLIFFKKPFLLVAQNTKMKDATDGFDYDYMPFETDIYNIVGIRLKKKEFKRNSALMHFGPREMYKDVDKRKDYWGHRFPFDMMDEYL